MGDYKLITNTIGELSNRSIKKDIMEAVNKAFSNKELYNIFESKRNIVVEHKEYNRERHAIVILRIMFKESGELVALLASDWIELGLEEIEINGRKACAENLVDFLKSFGYRLSACCPFKTENLGTEQLEDWSTIKECDSEQESCRNCMRRSRRELTVEFPDFRIDYNIDHCNDLLIYNNGVDINGVEYGYVKSIDDTYIEDKADIWHTVRIGDCHLWASQEKERQEREKKEKESNEGFDFEAYGYDEEDFEEEDFEEEEEQEYFDEDFDPDEEFLDDDYDYNAQFDAELEALKYKHLL